MMVAIRFGTMAFRLALAGAAFALLAPVGGAWAQGGPVPVTVAAVVKRDVPIQLRNIGTVQANQMALIRSRVDGTIEQIFFAEGQEVKKGDRLALIDPRPYQAAYDQAVAKKAADAAVLVGAQKDLVRSQQLVTSNFTPQQTVDQRTAVVQQLQAQIQSDDAQIAAAKTNLDYTQITAPFDGRMGLRQLDVGNVVRLADATGVGLATIAQVHPIAVVFTLPQDALPAIQTALAAGRPQVVAYSPDEASLLARGELSTTDNAIDTATGTIKVKAMFENTDNRLWPGQFVNARLQTDMKRDALSVPSSAVQRSQTELFVYLAKPDNTVAVQKVEIGQDDGQTVIVTKGLSEGALVVVAGQSRLRNGATVTVTQAKPAS
jgi:multidrug efflux system membrane fusion protein